MTNSFIISQSFQSSQHSDINFRILAERCSELARELKRRIKGQFRWFLTTLKWRILVDCSGDNGGRVGIAFVAVVTGVLS